MERRTTTKRIGIVAVAGLVAAVAIPVAVASGSQSDPGLVARKLGSPDPHEQVTKFRHHSNARHASGIVAGRLGSPDPRETAALSTAPSAVATTLGSPDPREAAINLRYMGGVSMSAGLENGYNMKSSPSSAVASSLGSPDPRDTALVESQNAVATSTFHWGDFGIGIGFGIGLAAILAGAGILAAVTLRGRSVAQPLA